MNKMFYQIFFLYETPENECADIPISCVGLSDNKKFGLRELRHVGAALL
jgi:hypothetical protein